MAYPDPIPVQMVNGVVSLGILGGMFVLAPGQSLVITYLVAPSITYWAM